MALTAAASSVSLDGRSGIGLKSGRQGWGTEPARVLPHVAGRAIGYKCLLRN